MISRAFTNLIHSLIREHKSSSADGYYLSVDDIPYYDQRIFLSHLIPINDFEDYSNTKEIMIAALDDYHEEMQMLINQELEIVYSEDMEEKKLRLCRLSNGDVEWMKAS